jgi:putative PIN family toxin of toxin-antitoxin system
MQKVIIDTNVLVSNLIQKSYPHYIVRGLFLNNKFKLCISENLFWEYKDVLHRRKFAKYPNFYKGADFLLKYIKEYSETFSPTIRINILEDKDDNMLLELADESKANFLITGNVNDFLIPKYKETLIVSPVDYWENYKPD